MSSLKQKGISLILLLAVYLWFFIGHLPNLATQKNNVLSATSSVSVFVQPDTGKQPILEAINSASHEILVEVYLLSDKDVILALENARARGVAVDIMLEQHPFGGGNLNNRSKTELTSKNISVEWTNPEFSLTHEKSIVIDASKAFILNQNLTASSFSKNREYDVLDKDLADVNQVHAIFVNDWERKTFIEKASHLVISPNNARSAISSLILSSSSSLDLESEDINDDQIVSLLITLAKKEKVRIITPTISQISSNKKAISALKAGGVEVRTLSSPYIHAKLIIADGIKAYVGSVNLSSQSLDKNRELGIIISERESIQVLQQTFQTDWSNASDFNQN